jgi:hypothetical protein
VNDAITPFRADLSEAAIDYLRERLRGSDGRLWFALVTQHLLACRAVTAADDHGSATTTAV